MSTTADPTVEQRLRAFGLLPAEYDLILGRLDREPNHVELGMLGAMWSEHCSYKHSRKLLRQLPTSGPRVVQGPGENAGAVDIGDGLAVVLKMESHNHPSAVEPFQGAATGVGGILRDIFTMGARPVAILDSLRFGAYDDARTQYVLGGVVGGIGHYGNCLAGEERLIWRTPDRVVHFGTIREFVDARLEPVRGEEDVSDAGTEVLSAEPGADGAACWKPVRRVFKRRAARLLRLRTSLGRHLRLTPEHPVLVHDGHWTFRAAAELRPGDQVALSLAMPGETVEPPAAIDLIEILRARAPLAAGVWVDLPESWRPSEQVRIALRRLEPQADRRYEYLKRRRLPWHHFVRLEAVLGFAHSDLRVHRRSGKANVMNAVIQPDAQFARLLGYFASEGCVSTNGTTDVVAFTFGRHEQPYVDDVVAAVLALGLRPRVIYRESTIAVYVASWLLGSLLRDVWECGSNSLNKALPGFVFAWSGALQFEVLKGLFRGDGCLTKSHEHRVKISFASSSRTLFEQAVALVHNRRIVPSCHARPAAKSAIGERSLVWSPSWHLEITRQSDLEQLRGLFGEDRDRDLARALLRPVNAQLARPRARLHDKLATVAITEVEREDPSEDGEFVYDLEVEDTHCFVTSGGVTVHNCFGTPTVGGEITFDAGYAGNPIVNAMCVGVVKTDRLMRAGASGPGNSLLLVGADTGRDGLQGAAFASNDDPEASHRGVVQVGNPFLEKLLLEACLTVLETDDVLAMQDLGAAGLTSSAIEMAARGGLGVDLDVARVPRRETGLGAFEVMLSESQERMLLLVRAGREAAIQAHFARWELHAAIIGQVMEEPLIRVRDEGAVVAELPIALLTDDVPAYELQVEAPTSATLADAADQGETPGGQKVLGGEFGEASGGEFGDELLRLLASPNLRSRHFAFRQYDSTVQGNTALGPGLAAAVVRVEGTTKGLAITTDCNPRYMRLDPRRGAMQAVAEAARNLACVGAEPIAVTDCLNFGNPEKPQVAWQLTEAIAGLSEACRTLGVPIVSGNVSLYNEAAGRAIPPTPTVGMVGLLEDVRRVVRTGFAPGRTLVILGQAPTRVGASEFRPDADGFPRFDLDSERRLGALLRELASRGLVQSAQDVADGGLAVALAECALLGECGAILQLEGPSMEATLFSEDQGRAVVACEAATVEALMTLAEAHQIPARAVGQTGGDRLRVAGALDLGLGDLRAAWEPAQ